MTAVFALVTGTLFRQAEEKTSTKTGRTFVSAVIKVGGDGDAAEFWQATAFSQSAQAELLRLSAGDALSCQGKARFELWQPRAGGEVKISRSIFADQILALKAPPRERRSKQTATTPLLDQPAPQRPTAASLGLDDDIPF